MNWETVIGLETHVELATKSKIFCACTTAFGGAPNTHCCPVCTGMPGALPVLNGKVVEYAVRAALALGCTVTRYSRFDRKNYFYPDLPKAYQISQLYLPIGRDGAVEAGGRTVGIHELHMEEDAGKLIHDPWTEQTKIDYNRCGVPLIEIVTEPDFRTAEEVVSYLEWLRETLQYLGVSDCKMQEGSLRCDVNLSVRPAGSDTLGTRTELKNLSSFKAIRRAIYYEARRQIERLEAGGRVVQETRRWDENKDASYPMRSKEDAQDYRYFPEPDLPPLELSEAYIQALRASQPELATAKRARYQAAWGLGPYDAEMLTSQKALARFFEETVALGAYFNQSEDQKIPSFGTVAALAEETAASLAAYYQKMLAEDQVDIFVLGDVNEAELVPLFKQLPFTPREEGKAAIFYNQPIRNVIEERTEREVLAQSKLNLAYNTDIYYGDSYYFALQVFNGIFGGFPHSKLFMNVREKKHLAYYASSSIDTFRGFMTVQTGIDGKNRNQVLRLISTELENIRLGKISELEIEQTKAMLKNQYILALDNAGAWLEKEYLNQLMPQTMLTAEEWIARINAVTISEIQEVAKRFELQAIFFLEGETEND